MTTVLSACGGFTTRRNIHIQAKNELKLATTLAKTLEPELKTAATTTLTTTAAAAAAATTATTTQYTNNCCRLSMQQFYSVIPTANFWVLGALLLAVTFSLPTSTNALPRRMYGRHLILPHRHHVHLRSVVQDIKHVYPPAVPLLSNCTKHKMDVTADQFTNAKNVSIKTREQIVGKLEEWLKNVASLSLEQAREQNSLHHLNLIYPLSAEAKNLEYDGTDTDATDEELHKILDSLNIVHHLMSELFRQQPRSHSEKYFAYLPEKIQHNKSEVLRMLNKVEDCVTVPEYSYNDKHNSLEYAILIESINLLNVIEKKYSVMSEKKNQMNMG